MRRFPEKRSLFTTRVVKGEDSFLSTCGQTRSPAPSEESLQYVLALENKSDSPSSNASEARHRMYHQLCVHRGATEEGLRPG